MKKAEFKGQTGLKKGLLVMFFVVMIATFQTLSLKANVGVCACWDAVSMNIYELFGIKVGTVSIILNCSCVLIQFLLLRKDFSLLKLLQVPLALLSGTVVNLMYYKVFTFDIHSYIARIFLLILSYGGLAIFVGALTIMDIITMPPEAVCYTINKKYGVPFSRLRTSIDILCITVSLALSLFFDLSLKIREGTLIGLFLLGPLMGKCMKAEKKWFGRYLCSL